MRRKRGERRSEKTGGIWETEKESCVVNVGHELPVIEGHKGLGKIQWNNEIKHCILRLYPLGV